MSIRRRVLLLITGLFLAGFAAAAGAEEKFGVTVHAGAKYDAATSKALTDAMHINGACYRTKDSVAKVVEFYRKQPGLTFMGGDKESAMFKKGKVDITIQNPWMDMKTGKMNTDTLISIVQNE